MLHTKGGSKYVKTAQSIISAQAPRAISDTCSEIPKCSATITAVIKLERGKSSCRGFRRDYLQYNITGI